MKKTLMLLGVLVHEPLLWGGIAAVSAFLVLGTFLSQPLYGPFLMQQVLMQNHAAHAAMQEEMHSNQTVPEGYADNLDERIEAEEQAMSAQTDADIFLASMKYDELTLESLDLLGASSADDISYYLADKKLCSMILELPVPEGYDESAELPAIYAISFAPSALPHVVLLLPGLLIGYLVAHNTSRGRLLGRRTIHSIRLLMMESASTVIVSIIACALCFAPLILITGAVNGLGDGNYPVVFTQGGILHSMTAGQCAGWTVALFALSNSFISVSCAALSWATESSLAGIASGAVLALIGDIPSYFSPASVTVSLAEWLPFSYFVPQRIVGFVGIFPDSDITPLNILEPAMGLEIMVTGIFCILAAVLVIYLVSDALRSGKEAFRHACAS